jgi:hypothetical protein
MNVFACAAAPLEPAHPVQKLADNQAQRSVSLLTRVRKEHASASG